MAVVVAKTVAVFVGVRLALTATSERYDVRTEHYLSVEKFFSTSTWTVIYTAESSAHYI